MIAEVNYKPRPKQELFHASGAQDCLFGGAKSPGKSCALTMEGVAYALEYPGSTPYLFRRTYDDLEANLIQELLKRVPDRLFSWDRQRHEATFKNKPASVLKFRYISCLEDAYGYNGRSIPWIGVDELTEHSEMAIQILRSCNRSAEGFPVRFRATANPGGIGHVHVYKRYVESTAGGQKMAIDPITKQSIQFIPANVYDGVLVETDPAYVRRLENLPEIEKQAYLYGNWNIFAGQFFKNLDREAHLVADFAIPREWVRWRSLDWGHVHNAVCLWWAADFDGNVYIYRALSRTEMSAPALAREIIQIGEDCGDENLVTVTVASPDLWTPLKEDEVYTGNLLSDMIVNAGLTIRRAVNARVPGWEYCRQLIEYQRDADGKIKKHPRLRIFGSCDWVYDHLLTRIHDPKKPEDMQKTPTPEDDTAEAFRYGAIHDRKTDSPEPQKTEWEKMVDEITGSSEQEEILTCGRS